MKPVAIIMPVHNGGNHVKHAILSIVRNTEFPYKLIIIESESTDGTDKVVDDWARQFKQIEVYHTKKEGLIKAINFGIKKAGESDVYLTQDDVIIPKLYGRDWLTTLVAISKSENCGLVTTLQGGGISGPDYVDGLFWVGTWSMYIPRSTIEKMCFYEEK